MNGERIPGAKPRMPAWLLIAGAALLLVLILWAANQWAGQTAETGFATGEPITVEGCLTGRANAFILTPIDLNPLGSALARSATDVQPTFTYELVGDPSDLQPHTSQVVSVTGIVAPDVKDEAEVDREEVTEPASGARGSSTPPDDGTVRTTQEVEIERRRMEVQSVQPAGRSCLESAPGGDVGIGSGEPQR